MRRILALLQGPSVSTLRFIQDVLRSPLQMGAILPSGPSLARAMVDEADIRPGHVVLELGAGSGALTEEIVARFPDGPLFLVELSPDLADGLAVRFPRARVITGRVEDLGSHAAAIGLRTVHRVVSGLPWALWGEARQAAVLDALTPFLAPAARLVTFHYAHSRALGRVTTTRRLLLQRFEQVHIGETVWLNVPPAYVHVAGFPRSTRHVSQPSSDRRTTSPVRA